MITRVTCDDLLYDPRWLFDDALDAFLANGTYDYFTAQTYIPEENRWIDKEPCCGCNFEIFTYEGIERCMNEATDPYCTEHVTPYFYMNPDLFHCGGFSSNYSGPNILPEKYGTSLDTEEDLLLLRKIYDALYPNNPQFSIQDVITCFQIHPEWQSIIDGISRTPVTYHGEGDKNTGWGEI